MFLKRKNKKDVFLVTAIPPLLPEKGEKTIDACFREEMRKANGVEISVAYCAGDSLKEVNRLVEEGNIKYICLILGTYFFIGFRESLYTLVMKIHDKWQKMGVGEIRLTDSFTHHGKLYCFYKNDRLFSAIIGSPNLSFLITEKKRKPRQYEIAELVHRYFSLKKYKRHIEKLKSDKLSKTLSFLERYKTVETAEEVSGNGEITIKTKITYTKNY